MAIQLGSAYGKIEIDASGVKRGTDNAIKSMESLQEKAKQLGATMQSVGKAMTVAITIPLALMGKQAVMAASDFVETKNKVAVVFKDMTDSVMKWSVGSAKSMHLSQQQALEAASTFGNLFIAMKIGTKESADMSMALVQLAADLGSMNNIDPTLVLAKLKSGIVGETEAVRDLGIDLRATTVEAKALEMGFVKVNGVFSQSSLIAARYAIIMEQTKVAQGDVARTGAEFAGQLVELKAHWGDTLRILGENLLPIVKEILTQLNKWLAWFNNADPKTQKFIATLLLIAFVAGPLLMLFGKLLPMAFAGATGSINPFHFSILGLVGTFVKWVGIAALVVKVLGALGIATGPVGAAILAVQAAIAGVGVSIASIVLPILLIIGTLALLYLAFKNNWFGITDTVKQAWFLIGYYINQMVVKIRDLFAKIDWKSFGKYMMQGLATGMLGGIPMIVSAAIKAGQMALAAIRKALGISSPSKEFMKLGVFSGQGFSAGLANAMNPNEIARTMAKPIQNMSSNTSTNNTINLSGGLTLRDVDEMMSRKINSFAGRLDKALGA